MNAEQFYEEIKGALRLFGLSFGQMDQMTITIEAGNWVTFHHMDKRYSVRIPTKE